jgi:hypothetical protein
MSHELSTTFTDDDVPSLMSEAAAAYLRDKGLPLRDSTIRTLRQRGLGPAYYRIAGRALYRRADLDAYVASCRVNPPKQADGTWHNEAADAQARE